MCWVQTCKRRSSQSTQDYHSIKFHLFLVTLGCGGSVTAFRLLCCVVICLLGLALFANVFPHSLQSNVVSVSNSWAAAHFPRRSFALTPDLICWSSLAIDLIWQNARTCLDGPDKMPTTEKSPDKMPTFGRHFVWLAFCPVGILSGCHFVLPPWFASLLSFSDIMHYIFTMWYVNKLFTLQHNLPNFFSKVKSRICMEYILGV